MIACAAGYVQLYLNSHLSDNMYGVGLCLIKRISGIPCPSCGSTRSVIAILKGEYSQALYWNPFGFILLIIMVIVPVLITYDFLLKRASLLHLYLYIEKSLKNQNISIPAILFVLLNWIWNIYKGL
jgi:hypothetical protein